MRIALAAAAFATMAAPIAADAQTVRRSGPMMSQSGRSFGTPQVRTFHNRLPNSGGRWGGMVGGRWYGGVHAPGGWQAYRRPFRGWALPTYWTAPSFQIYDWSNYGLGAPPQGHSWYRYYDDAVLADERGRVYDSRSDMRWDEREEVDELVYAERDGDVGAPYAPPLPGPPPARRDNGVGGALIGGAIGGVAGNVIAGRGNRLAGTLLGAGAGAIAGAAIDQAEDRGRRREFREYRDDRYAPPPSAYGDGFAYRDGGYREGYSVRGGYDAPPPAVINTPGGATVVTQSSGGWWGGSSTTVVVQPAVTTTTTTTEYVYESVAHAPRRARARTWKPRPRARVTCCVCKVVCR